MDKLPVSVTHNSEPWGFNQVKSLNSGKQEWYEYLKLPLCPTTLPRGDNQKSQSIGTGHNHKAGLSWLGLFGAEFSKSPLRN